VPYLGHSAKNALPSACRAALDKVFLKTLSLAFAECHLLALGKGFFAECQISSTRQSIFFNFQKIFAECPRQPGQPSSSLSLLLLSLSHRRVATATATPRPPPPCPRPARTRTTPRRAPAAPPPGPRRTPCPRRAPRACPRRAPAASPATRRLVRDPSSRPPGMIRFNIELIIYVYDYVNM
jgi:hypothetical protein